MSIFVQSFASENVIIFFYVSNTQNKALQAHTQANSTYGGFFHSHLHRLFFFKDWMLKDCLPLVISNEQHFKHRANKYYLDEQLLNDHTGYFSDAFDPVGTRPMGGLLP